MSNSADDLLVRVLLDQSERWRRGQPLYVEAYLQRHPALSEDTEKVLDLISNEIYLRKSARRGTQASRSIASAFRR